MALPSLMMLFCAIFMSSLQIGIGKYLDNPRKRSMTWPRPLVIGHRGASGTYPEHSRPAYEVAIDQGANYIESDITVTKDLVLVCIHQNWLKDISDAEEKYPEKETSRFIDDSFSWVRNDFFAIDFTLEELKTLRLDQRYDYRDPNYNGLYEILTFDEYIDIIQDSPHNVGIYAEVKDPDWTNSEPALKNANTTIERLLVDNLERRGYNEADGRCFIQSFSRRCLEDLSKMTSHPLMKLTALPLSNQDLDELSEFCYGIGPDKGLIVEVGLIDNRISGITDLVERAHFRGLAVHVWTFRNENRYLAFDYGQDPYEEYQLFTSLQIDGIHTDFTHSFIRYLEWVEGQM